MVSLSTTDYERMLDLAVAILDMRDPASGLTLLSQELHESLHSNFCLFVDNARPDRGTGYVTAWAPGPLDDLGRAGLDAALQSTIATCVLANHYQTTRDLAPLTLSDVASRTFYERTAAYQAVSGQFGSSGAVHELCVPLPAPPGTIRTFLMFRPPGDNYTERDQAYAQRVQPLLVRADRHMRHLEKWGGSVGTRQGQRAEMMERAASARLTPRELTVLHLLAQGFTAAAIGRRLGITPATAVKHKENLYRKLDASDKITAVVRAQSWGLLPTPHQ